MRKRWLWALAAVLVLDCTGAAEFVEAKNPAPPDAPSASASSNVTPSIDAGTPLPDAAP